MAITKVGDPFILSTSCFFFITFVALELCPLFSNCERDTLLQGQELKDGYHLVSAFGVFVLGFFTAPNSHHRYLGIWYRNPENNRVIGRNQRSYYSITRKIRPVWVGNRDTPLDDKTGYLVIGSDGNLRVVNGGGDRVAEVSTAVVSGPTTAVLMDTGNLVLKELNPNGTVKRQVWQSFDYPTNTLLPGMRIGANLRTGHVWSLKPWPGSSSKFSFGLDPKRTSEMVIWWEGQVYWRSGAWLNQTFRGFNFTFESSNNGEERYMNMIYSAKGGDLEQGDGSFPGITITSDGALVGQDYLREDTYQYFYVDQYKYVDCGRNVDVGCFGDDDIDTPICLGYNDYNYYIYYDGGKEQVYEEMRSRKVSLQLQSGCRSSNCSSATNNNCSCVYYATQNSDGSGCQMGRRIIYSTVDRRRNGTQPLLIIIGVVVPSTILLLFFYLGWRRHNHLSTTIRGVVTASARHIWKSCRSLLAMWKKYILLRLAMTIADAEQEILLHELGMGSSSRRHHEANANDFQLFSFETIASATNKFHPSNKLGQGGFGPVYKGKLASGLEVAIKRLAASSKQGIVEFKNEVRLIAKLQHDNLVRLVGCCIDKGEKILVYEYLPNKSLDFSLFAPTNQNRLDWKKRFDIIQGIAQGLVYLHKYSRLKIVHRDLKASNILLDSEMKAKISDFGLAKIFHANESRAITARVAGTFGYMSPEYALEGIFSTRSDVFSFGVLLLEIVSGKRNNHFRRDEGGPSSLVTWAWELWRQGRGCELVDSGMDDRSNEYCENEALKCIRIGLLCVQEKPRDRPSMLEITSMLYNNNETAQLPSPNQPAFYYRVNLNDVEAQIIEEPEAEGNNHTLNQVTITEIDGR